MKNGLVWCRTTIGCQEIRLTSNSRHRLGWTWALPRLKWTFRSEARNLLLLIVYLVVYVCSLTPVEFSDRSILFSVLNEELVQLLDIAIWVGGPANGGDKQIDEDEGRVPPHKSFNLSRQVVLHGPIKAHSDANCCSTNTLRSRATPHQHRRDSDTPTPPTERATFYQFIVCLSRNFNFKLDL